MNINQFVAVSSAATQFYNSTQSASNLVIANLGPSYKILVLSSSNQNTNQGFPIKPGCVVTLPVGSNANLFAQMAGQVGANASTVFAQFAVYAAP